MKTWTLLFLVLTLFVCVPAASGQTPTPSPQPAAAPPTSDIFIIDINYKKDVKPFGQPKKITDYPGYNNQPFFMPGGNSLLYTSNRNSQADIYLYDLRSGQTSQITQTSESEYSPTLMPDGKNISVVRVEADGTQRLWKFPLKGGPPAVILENVKPVGYHHWIDDHTLALFVLGGAGKPNTLQIADTRSGKTEIVSENPGRILRRVPDHSERFSFVHKISDQHWEIKQFDMRTRTSSSLIETLPGVEDYAWLPDGRLLMGKEAKLFVVRPLSGQKWTEAGDLSASGIKRITRIAVDGGGKRMALVGVTERK
jgi:Tol biopolymer transport system component